MNSPPPPGPPPTGQPPPDPSPEAIVDELRRLTGDGCFACGRDNPVGLRMDGFALRDGDVTARFTARPDFAGTIGRLHGGVAAAALDEILVWAGILQEGVLTITGKLEIRYERPLDNAGEEVSAQARVERRRGRRLVISGELDDPSGVRAVSARGLYLVSDTLEELRAAYPRRAP